jgi:thioredoxin 1
MNETIDFHKEVLSSKETVLVDFWAEWCAPCKNMASVIEKVKDKIPMKIVKINVDHQKELAENHGIRTLPTCVVFKEGKEIGRLLGALPEVLFHQKIIETLKVT